ncbi:hypothetical protein ACG9YX_12560 [Acinetobacter nematophilus]|uniref:hypothetical protein n=1 Tax=Acinetobacter nematophilus TaxID=2994642 RepID=UPI003AF97442
MKIKLNLVFITSIVIGFWYVSGRSYLDGLMNSTGFSTAHLGVDVSDYAYYGFLYSYHQILWVGVGISSIFLIIELVKRKSKILKEFYFFLAWLKHNFFEKGMQFNEIKVRNRISSKMLEDSLNAKELNFPLILNLWSAFNVFFPFILLAVIYNWIDFYNEGTERRKKEILDGISYIESDNDKYFELICGKETCIYTTKDFSKSISKKEYTIKTKTLKSTNTQNLINKEKLFPAFEFNKETNKDYITYFYQISMTKELNQNDLKNNLKLLSKSKKIYAPISNDKTIFLNSLSKESNSPIFLAFKIPSNEHVDFIFAHKIPYKFHLLN